MAIAMLLAMPATAGAQELSARRVQGAPVIDGRADDAAWRDAPATSAFTVFRPTEGAEPTYRTETRVVYDARTLYVLVRAFDPHPDSIVGLLSRRDNFGPPSDLIQLYIDSYHDGRNGYEYVVNPAGVKADFLLFDDDRFDLSWDGIWDVGTQVDSLGWVAEFAIPFAQMRFRGRPGLESKFGIMVWRTVGRLGERTSWPHYRPTLQGLVSQFTTLNGLSDLPGGMRLEAAPYALARGQNKPTATGTSIQSKLALGGDLKFGPGPNITVEATINPDFGQVESDPAVLNLTSFETFLPERRPFFLEGAGLFRFTLSRDPNSPESLFYTRRIGRAPQLAGTYGDPDTPTETTILGAAKLTSRFGGSTSLASLAAVTGDEHGAVNPGGGRYLVEPRTMYSITRVQRDFRSGRSGLGFIATGMDRNLDSLTGTLLPRRAYSGGVLTQHQSRDGRFWTRAWAAATRIEGTPQAITRIQTSLPHAYQRPDDHNDLDTTAMSISGSAGQLWLGKVGGVMRFGTSYRYFSPGFDPADVGYIRESNHKSLTQDIGIQATRASSWYRSANAMMIHITWWSGAGRIDEMLHANAFVELHSQWSVAINTSLTQVGGTVCSQSCTRGGPAIRKEPSAGINVSLFGDPRRPLQPDLSVNYVEDDGGRSHRFTVQPGLQWRAASNVQLGVSTTFEDLTSDQQFYKRFGAVTSDTSHYTVARLEQATRALTTRVSYAATPTLSVQWYAQPFIAKGTFADVRELSATPRSPTYGQRFVPYSDATVTSAPGGIDFQQFRSNLVTRWEYRPGSVVFVVWTQGRDFSAAQASSLRLGQDARDLFALAPKNTIAVKASYWYGR